VKRREFIARQPSLALFSDAKLDPRAQARSCRNDGLINE
jgi:hypothetical protein